MAAVAHDRTPANGVRVKRLPPGDEKSVFLTHRPVVFDIGKIDDELGPNGTDFSALINAQRRRILFF